MLEQDDYREDHSVMQDLLALLVADLDLCVRQGCQMRSGATLHLVVLGVKGDWSFLAAGFLNQLVVGLDVAYRGIKPIRYLYMVNLFM